MASAEALTPPGYLPAIIAADGDGTIKTRVIDVVRNYEWPADFGRPALRTPFVNEWHGRETALLDPSTNATEKEAFWQAFHAGDAEGTGVFRGKQLG